MSNPNVIPQNLGARFSIPSLNNEGPETPLNPPVPVEPLIHDPLVLSFNAENAFSMLMQKVLALETKCEQLEQKIEQSETDSANLAAENKKALDLIMFSINKTFEQTSNNVDIIKANLTTLKDVFKEHWHVVNGYVGSGFMMIDLGNGSTPKFVLAAGSDESEQKFKTTNPACYDLSGNSFIDG